MNNCVASSAVLCACALTSLSNAAVLNGGFEAGSLSGWTLAGQGAAVTASTGVTPTAGTYQGFIDTTGNYTWLAPAVVASLGVPGSAIFGLGQGAPTNGSGISQMVTVSAGDVLSFDWNFATSELSQDPMYNDFAFFTVNGSAYFLASRNASSFNIVAPPIGFEGQTNWASASYTFAAAGTYQIGFGVFNVGDSGHDSALFLDNVDIVPEPAILSMLGFACAPLARRRL